MGKIHFLFQWFDSIDRQNPSSLSHLCHGSIRSHLQQALSGKSIYTAIEIGLQEELPAILRNYLMLQDGKEENWLELYKNNADLFEKMFIMIDESMDDYSL